MTSIACCLTPLAWAEPWADPGDTRLRNDLQLLNDSGVFNLPLTAWPIAWGDIDHGMQDADVAEVTPEVWGAYVRVRELVKQAVDGGAPAVRLSVSAADNPRTLRSFEDTPREDGELLAGLAWSGQRFSFRLQGAYADNPLDGDEFRPDGTVIGMSLGNWLLAAGWQERWWGPGRDASMILGTNARPPPSIGIQRVKSLRSESKWFGWMGPWTLSSFFALLDDERVVNDAVLFGLRFSMRPIESLEISLVRSAQMCGEGRKCDLEAFLNMLRGKDNAGANVNPDEEPGNQLGGIDIRWKLPKQLPLALYMQWIAEDTRDTGGSLHQWLRQFGVEYWGTIGGLSHRTHLEIGDTLARGGGLGEGRKWPNSAYNHGIFQTGYRYNGRSLGHAMDGDGLSYSIGSSLVQDAGHTWNISLRYMEINRAGIPDFNHTLSATPQDFADIQVSYERLTDVGRFYLGVGYSRLDDEASGLETTDYGGFLRWSLP